MFLLGTNLRLYARPVWTCKGASGVLECAFALTAPPSFPHLWKNLWKRTQGSCGESGIRSPAFYRSGCDHSPSPLKPPMSATTIWDQVLTLIEAKVGPHSFSTWFKPTSLKADQGRALVIRVPTPLYVEWLPQALFGRPGRGAAPRSAGPRSSWSSRSRAPRRLGSPYRAETPCSRSRLMIHDPQPPASTASVSRRDPGGPESPLHLRHVHRRTVEPVCARRVPRRRRSAVALLQPAVHLRRRRTRQDALDARDRPLRACSTIRL